MVDYHIMSNGDVELVGGYIDFQKKKVDVLKDGRIIIYQRADVVGKKPSWHVRLSHPQMKRYKLKTLKTNNKNEAIIRAKSFWDDLDYEIRQGKSPNIKTKGFSKTIKQVFEEYIKWHKLRNPNKSSSYYKDEYVRLNHLFIRKFGKKQMSSINRDLLNQYKKLRQTHNFKLDKSVKNVSVHTLRHEYKRIKSFLQYAIKEEEWVDKNDLLDELKVRDTYDKGRTYWRKDEWRKLTRHLKKRITEKIENRGKKFLNPRFQRDRFYLYNFVMIMSNTGIRPGNESRAIRWKDIERTKDLNGNLLKTIYVSQSKTKRRKVVCNPKVEDYLKNIYEWRKKELGHKPSDEENVFINREGHPVISYGQQFNKVLKDLDLYNDKQSKDTRSIYSLRHQYISMKVIEKVSYAVIAENTGTSADMIQKYYKHIDAGSPSFVSQITAGTFPKQKETEL